MVDFCKRLVCCTSGKKKTICHYRSWPILVILLPMSRRVTKHQTRMWF